MRMKNKISDYDLESAMGSLLIIGVTISGALILFGGVHYLFGHGFSNTDYSTFRGESSHLRSVKQIIKGAFHLDSLSIIQFGLLLLIATPVSRVLFAVVGFFFEKDYLYVLVSLIVLAIIAFSLFNIAA